MPGQPESRRFVVLPFDEKLRLASNVLVKNKYGISTNGLPIHEEHEEHEEHPCDQLAVPRRMDAMS